MKLPESFLQAIASAPGLSHKSFLAAHEQPVPVTSIRYNPIKTTCNERDCFPFNPSTLIADAGPLFASAEPVAWSAQGRYLARRPSFTFDPLFHAGCYYVQEASSMFLEQAMKQHGAMGPQRVLDLSAAPGGKSTHLQSLLPPGSLLVSNEVIRNRMQVLQQNVVRWGADNIFVTNNDPAGFAALPGFFDIMVVDAPCSGSGLFRRDAAALDEWSPGHVQLCAQRQQRILADALPALKQGGLLIYSTCSYSPEENEEIGKWLMRDFAFESLPLSLADEWNVVQSKSDGFYGYRFYPDKLKGEGFFLACLRRADEPPRARYKSNGFSQASSGEVKAISSWVKPSDHLVVPFRKAFISLPEHFKHDFNIINSHLNLFYAGVRVGEVIRDKLIPDHALALSALAEPGLPFITLNLDQAIEYLQKKEMNVHPEKTGWQLVRYRHQNLGWINALKNRINNYYPKDLRILKQQNTSGSDNL